MRVDKTAAGLSILAACTTNVKQWYMQNGLQLNPDKSEVLFMGTDLQSAYRAHHSTETAVLKVLSDILMAIDKGDLAILVTLGLIGCFRLCRSVEPTSLTTHLLRIG